MDHPANEETKQSHPQQEFPKSQLLHMTLQEQIQLGQAYLEQLHLEEAKQVFESVLETDPKNLEAADLYTDVLEQLDQVELMETTIKSLLVEENQQLFQQYPSSYKLLFKYASTQGGKVSVQHYKIGIMLLEKQLSDTQNVSGDTSMLKDLADAHAAIAEIYQTDLLEFKESEQECVNHINFALKYDPNNLDAFFQLANYHLFKEQEDLAAKELKVVYERLMVDDDDQYDQDFKLQTSKLLLEVEMINESKLLLRKAVDQNEKNVEVLYMLAFCLWKLKELPEAYRIAQGIMNMEETKQDEEIMTATQELIAELEKHQLASTKMQNDEEEEWMDIE